jgi:hypothetical protein
MALRIKQGMGVWVRTVDFMSTVKKFVKGEVRVQRLVAPPLALMEMIGGSMRASPEC